MKTISVTLLNNYSCQVCGKIFTSQKEYNISRGYKPLCSTRCLFNIYYRIYKDYGEKDLFSLAETLQISNYKNLTKNNLVFEVCKKYPKPSLTTINESWTLDIDRKSLTSQRQTLTLDNHSPPILIGGCPSHCLSLVKGELDKWF